MTCPSCGSERIFSSRLRNRLEALRRHLTDRQPYRCHDCGLRSWQHVLPRDNRDVQPEDLRIRRDAAPVSAGELDPLDPASREPEVVTDVELDPLDPKVPS
jgi:hypothetical protein